MATTPQSRTATQRLADQLLGGSLDDYVLERRPSLSWRMIARELHTDTLGEVDVTSETLRLWYAERAKASA